MTNEFSKIQSSINKSGTINSAHRTIALGAYLVFMAGVLVVELLVSYRYAVHERWALILVMLVISGYQLAQIYAPTTEDNTLETLSKSMNFSFFGSALWTLTLLPVLDAEIALILMTVLVFQTSVFVSLARFLVELIQLSLIGTFALLVCVTVQAQSLASFALLLLSGCFLVVLWWRLLLSQKNMQMVLKMGVNTEESNRQLKETQELLKEESRTDQMTRIGNRRAFYEYCESIKPDLSESRYIIALLDLDKFKQVNDVYGHEAGDKLINATATRLDAALAPDGRIFRFGGDEFVILFKDDQEYAFDNLKQTLDQALDTRIPHKGVKLQINWSLGAAAVPGDADSARSILSQADKALYKAKTLSSNAMHIFGEDDLLEMNSEAMLRAHTSEVLSNGKFSMFGQPVIEMEESGFFLNAVEALVRVQSASGDEISADSFVKQALSTGRTSQLTHWSFRNAVSMLREAKLDTNLSLNLSCEQVISPTLLNEIVEVTRLTNFDPKQLIIEVSEVSFSGDTQALRNSFDLLKQLGVRIVLDDFGAGSTSFSTIVDFKVDMIKTDPKLLASALSNKSSAMIFRKVVEMCASLDIGCIAGGVESKREFYFAKEAGCTMFQGYYFGRPAAQPDLGALTWSPETKTTGRSKKGPRLKLAT